MAFVVLRQILALCIAIGPGLCQTRLLACSSSVSSVGSHDPGRISVWARGINYHVHHVSARDSAMSHDVPLMEVATGLDQTISNEAPKLLNELKERCSGTS